MQFQKTIIIILKISKFLNRNINIPYISLYGCIFIVNNRDNRQLGIKYGNIHSFGRAYKKRQVRGFIRSLLRSIECESFANDDLIQLHTIFSRMRISPYGTMNKNGRQWSLVFPICYSYGPIKKIII